MKRSSALFPLGLAALSLVLACSGAKQAAVTPAPETGAAKVVRNIDPVRAVNMTSADAYEADDTQATAKTITVGAAVQEHNFFDDATDWSKFSAVAGTKYTIETSVLGTADTIITLYDGTTSLATNDDKGDGTYGSKLTWTAPATKTYTLKTASYNGKTGTNLGYTISVTGGTTPPPPPIITLPQPKKSWTVLVYLDGDNSLASFAAGNIAQMKQVGSDTNLNIVLLWDSTDSTHGYYYVQPGTNTLLQDLGEVDMGSVGTAKNFIDYATNNFPADKYMFVYWNHGGAVDRGVCWDDASGTHLSEVNQKDIMNYAVTRFGKKLEVVGFDACLMSTAEIFYQYRNVANYMAASEQTEPGAGWDYNALSVIKNDPTVNGDVVTKSICTKYAALTASGGTSDWTFAAINLAYAPQLATAINDFATTAMASGVAGSTFKTLAAGLPNFTGYTKDLTGLMNAVLASSSMPQTVKDKATAVKNLITGSLVMQNQCGSTWTNKAFGCSITMKSDTATYDLLDLCADTKWNEFCTFAGFPNS